MRWLALAVAAAAAGVLGQSLPVQEDPPLASRPASGRVTGTIRPAGKVARVYAVCRATGQQYRADSYDRASGQFAFGNLPGDAAYDVGIQTADGARIEGIDLSWFEARMLRLAALRRAQLKLTPEKPRAFTLDDVAELTRYVRDLKDFCDLRRVLYLSGNGPRATMLVEAMRTQPFHDQKADEVVWRVELWYFQFRAGGWERVPNVERVLQRRRIPLAEWRKITLVYYPQLSVHLDENGRSPRVEFEIPAALDPARGRIAGTDPAADTKPIIIGLAERDDGRTTTQGSR
jgi:hypothetical protein